MHISFFSDCFFFWPSSILRISSSKRFYSNSKYLFKIVSDGLILKKEKKGTWTKASPKVKSNSIRTVRKGTCKITHWYGVQAEITNQKLSRMHNRRVNFKSSTLGSKILGYPWSFIIDLFQAKFEFAFECRLAHGGPTKIIRNFKNIKELYQQMAMALEININNILFVTVNTPKVSHYNILSSNNAWSPYP